MKHIFTIVVLWVSSAVFAAAASVSDTTFHISAIHPHSPFEQRTFEKTVLDHQEDYFSLFTALSPKVDSATSAAYYREYQQLLSSVRKELLHKKDERQQIKTIYKVVHKTLLRKYELENEFSSIFVDGSYNCVSATALYSMILQDLNIPYVIKEAPTHVYLVAWPQSKRILVESTDPRKGFFEFSQEFKHRYISHLKEGKLISAQDLTQYSTDELFDKYYFTDGSISLQQLAGIQYSNSGISRMNTENSEEAVKQFEKSYLLYPCKRTSYLLLAATAQELSKGDYSKPHQAEYLAKAAKYEAYGFEPEIIIGEFGRITEKHLIHNYNPVKYDSLYQLLAPHLVNQEAKEQIGLVYHYERARIHFSKGEYLEALPFAEKALQYKPEHVDAQSLLLSSLARRVETESNYLEVVQILQEYAARHGFLNKHTLFNGMLLNMYLVLTGQQFEINKATQGEKWRTQFETAYKEKAGTRVDQQLLARAYSQAAIYYFRQGNTTKAKSILHKGLEISPGNYELTTRLQMLR